MHARATRFGLVAALVAAVLMLSAGRVAAGTTGGSGTDGYFTQNGKTADVFSFDCVSNGDGTTTCTGFSLNAFSGKLSDNLSGVSHSNQVCLGLDTWTTNDDTGEFVGTAVSERGCEVDLPNGAIKFGANLSSAALIGVRVSVQQFDCSDKTDCIPGGTRTVGVSGSWTGIGPITSSKYRSTNRGEICREYDAGKGSNREARFTGTIDGSAAGSNGFASLGVGKFTYRSRCVEV